MINKADWDQMGVGSVRPSRGTAGTTGTPRTNYKKPGAGGAKTGGTGRVQKPKKRVFGGDQTSGVGNYPSNMRPYISPAEKRRRAQQRATRALEEQQPKVQKRQRMSQIALPGGGQLSAPAIPNYPVIQQPQPQPIQPVQPQPVVYPVPQVQAAPGMLNTMPYFTNQQMMGINMANVQSPYMTRFQRA